MSESYDLETGTLDRASEVDASSDVRHHDYQRSLDLDGLHLIHLSSLCLVSKDFSLGCMACSYSDPSAGS